MCIWNEHADVIEKGADELSILVRALRDSMKREMIHATEDESP